MKTTLTSEGLIGIPAEVREADQLSPGDSFDLERLSPGHYLLAKQKAAIRFNVIIGDDGLPIIRGKEGIITLQLVKELDSQSQ